MNWYTAGEYQVAHEKLFLISLLPTIFMIDDGAMLSFAWNVSNKKKLYWISERK